MYLTKSGRFVRTDIWREGAWLDLWSVVHVLSGISIGLGLYIVHIDALASVALTFVSLVAYELWEVVVRIEETPTNRIMDVVVGMVGFVPTFFLAAPSLPSFHLFVLFSVVLVLNIALAAMGWYASQKAARLEERLRQRFAAQRARFARRRMRSHKEPW